LSVASTTAFETRRVMKCCNANRTALISSKLGRLRIRPLQFFLQEHWVSASQVWEALVPILPVLLPHLDWWTRRGNVLTGVALLHPVPSLTLYTDSSLQGWGAFLEGKSVSGVWSLVQQQEHINLLEMRAVLLALQHFKTLPSLKTGICIQS
jgi:hypothetical protein